MTNNPIGPAKPGILETEIDGEVSLYNPVEEKVTILNGTATDVWYLCDGSMTLDQMVTTLARSYDVEPNQIRQEVLRTIDEIRAAGLLDS